MGQQACLVRVIYPNSIELREELSMMRRILLFAAAALLLSGSALEAADVIATNLNNPRGITVGPEGALYVAEAGKGDKDGPCIQGEMGKVCAGLSGSITRIDLKKGTQERIVT